MSSEEPPKTEAPSLESRITSDKPAEDSVEAAQVDGAPTTGGGLAEPEYDVEVKLADLQADPNNPLFSAKSFEDLQLYVRLELLRKDGL